MKGWGTGKWISYKYKYRIEIRIHTKKEGQKCKKNYTIAVAETGARDIIRGCHNRGYGRE